MPSLLSLLWWRPKYVTGERLVRMRKTRTSCGVVLQEENYPLLTELNLGTYSQSPQAWTDLFFSLRAKHPYNTTKAAVSWNFILTFGRAAEWRDRQTHVHTDTPICFSVWVAQQKLSFLKLGSVQMHLVLVSWRKTAADGAVAKLDGEAAEHGEVRTAV